MRLEKHVKHCQTLFGVGGEDIHCWIDAFFDLKKYRAFLRNPLRNRFNPYDHRKHRHHFEALEPALKEFEGKYPKEMIEKIFIQHLKDDYRGYVPREADFDDQDFIRKYHSIFR